MELGKDNKCSSEDQCIITHDVTANKDKIFSDSAAEMINTFTGPAKNTIITSDQYCNNQAKSNRDAADTSRDAFD